MDLGFDAAEDPLGAVSGHHLRPHGLAVDDDFLSQLRAELVFGEIFVASCGDPAVEE